RSAGEQTGAGQLAEGQARGEFAVVGVVVAVCIDEPGAVDEEEQITEAPAAGMLEGQGVLLGRGDLVVVAIQIGNAVVLPLQQFGVGLCAGQGGAACEQRGGK